MRNKKKKVLWFTHTDSGYNRIFKKIDKKNHTGTWIESIVKYFRNQVDYELCIGFRSSSNDKIEIYGGVTYYPIFTGKSKEKAIERVFKKAIAKISWYEDVDNYLKVINEFKPDIIHVFGTEENFGLISNFTEIPVVLSIQGNLTVYEWKYFSGISKKDLLYSLSFKKLLKFSTSYNHYRIFKEKAKREREILKNIQYIIGRTDWDKRITRVLAPKSKYYYNDEILRDSFYKVSNVVSKIRNEIVIVTMSGPAIYKGLETVFMAINILNHLNFKFSWKIGGVDNKDDVISAVKSRLKENYPTNNYYLYGRLNEDEIIGILKESHIYVMPSHIENSPLTLSEAMILGLPIICADAGGTNSRLKNKEEGLLIQGGDPWSLVGSIIELSENFNQALSYGEKARRCALLRHNPDIIIESLKDIYSNILDS